MSMNKVNFVGGTQALYNAIVTKDPDSLYFISDTQRIYKGDVDVTQSVIPVLNFPATGVAGKLYIHKSTLETRIFEDGAWLTVDPGFVKTLEDLENAANGGKVATIDAFKAYVDKAMDARVAALFDDAGFDDVNGNLGFHRTGGDTSDLRLIQLTGVAHGPSYDATNLRITIPQYGKDDLVIDLPKDNFLTDAYFDKDYDFKDGTTGPAIVLVVKAEGQETKELAIPASAMANDYTAGKTDTIQVTIDADHKIKARVIIDANTADGTLMIWDGVGKKMGTIGVKINNNTAADMGDSNEVIPTAAVIAAAIKKASNEITGGLLDEGNPNEVVISTEHGIVRSGMVIGGATLSNTPNANTLATEAAVLDAISWKSLA